MRSPALRLLGLIAAAAACALVASASADAETASRQVEHLTTQLCALGPGVSASEARQLAARAHLCSAELARSYGAIGSPHFHNFLVNAGLKKRGLCHHWTRDLGERLASLKLRTLVLRWGIARAGTLREHNSVVVTARGQPFNHGIILDPWRHSGRLFSSAVRADKYPWKEDPLESFAADARRQTRSLTGCAASLRQATPERNRQKRPSARRLYRAEGQCRSSAETAAEICGFNRAADQKLHEFPRPRTEASKPPASWRRC